jgi:hypothetical protein
MTAQAPKLIDLILCDEVRREDNGKLIVVGMYLGSILAPRIPFTMPRLSFFCKWGTRGSLPTGAFRLTSPAKEPLGESRFTSGGDIPSATDVIYMSFTLQDIQLNQAGTYTLSFKPTHGRQFRPIFTFSVSLKDEAPSNGTSRIGCEGASRSG